MNPTFPVTIDNAALDQIKRLLSRKGSEGSFLRIGVKGGGCSGFEYFFRIDEVERDGDLVYTDDTTKIVCDPKSAAFLSGAELVFTGNLLGGGFAFNNPNSARSCGCGTSFTPKSL
jgi:iron-sulfur cluster assembly protein